MNYREKIYRHYATKFQSSGYQRPDIIDQWTKAYRWFLRGWLPAVSHASIVDVGCGGGQMLQVLRGLGFSRVRGVDVSLQQVEKARSAGFEVECGDAVEYLGRQAAGWDLILAIDVLEHLTKDEAIDFLEAAYKALVPGGRLVLQMPNPSAAGGMQVRYGDLTHEISLSPDCAGRLLTLLGFVNIESRETGPVPAWRHPWRTLRWVLWQLLRLQRIVFDIIETGGSTNRTLSRVYLISGCRPSREAAP